MLVVLTFLACMGAKMSGSCQAVEIAWDGSLFQCQMFGQMAVADWIRDHEGYALRSRLSCLSGRSI